MERKNKAAPLPSPRTISYLRVSTSDQNTDKNKADILLFAHNQGFGDVEFVEEVASSRVHWKQRKVGQIIDQLQPGDRLITPELSRLGRSLLENMELLSILQEKKVAVYDLKNGWELNGNLQSHVMAFAFSIAAQIERDLISSRTKEALKARKAAGVKLGRPKGPGKSKLDPKRDDIIEDLQRGVTKARIARRYDTTEANLHNWLKKNQIKVEVSQ